MTETQRADLVVRSNALKQAEAEAKERQGERTDLTLCPTGHNVPPAPKAREKVEAGQSHGRGQLVSDRSQANAPAPKARDIAGSAVGVSGTTVGRVVTGG